MTYTKKNPEWDGQEYVESVWDSRNVWKKDGKLVTKAIDDFKETVDKETALFKANLKKAGVVKKAQTLILQGESIRLCPYCYTFNAFLICYNEKEIWQSFKCEKCGKAFIVNWKTK